MSPIPQRYNLKAIHNAAFARALSVAGVTNTSKIQSESNSQPEPICEPASLRCHQYLKDTIWKQFTTTARWYVSAYWCHQYLKDTIWKQFTTRNIYVSRCLKVSPIPQRYNLKAIHNRSNTWNSSCAGVTNTSKIQSESNSQLAYKSKHTFLGCHQYLKDTIWKQFTTNCQLVLRPVAVSPIPQRYNLKAIHNPLAIAFFAM